MAVETTDTQCTLPEHIRPLVSLFLFRSLFLSLLTSLTPALAVQFVGSFTVLNLIIGVSILKVSFELLGWMKKGRCMSLAVHFLTVPCKLKAQCV